MSQVTTEYRQGETGEQIVVRNGWLEVCWEEDAQLVISDPLDPTTRVACGPLFELTPKRTERRGRIHGLGLDHTGAPQPVAIRDEHGPGIELRRRFPIAVQPLVAEWSIRVYERHAFIRSVCAIHNTGAEPLSIRRVFPFVTGVWWGNGALRLHGHKQDFAAYKNGWQSWSYSGGLPPGQSDLRPHAPQLTIWHSPGGTAPRQPIGGAVDVVSEGVALLGSQDERVALLAGFLSGNEWIGQVYAQRMEGAFAASVLCDDAILNPGESLTTPPLALALGSQQTLLSDYAEAVAREQGARRPSRTYTGWCSWYYYFGGVSAAAISENLRALQTLRPLLTLDLAQIDDGYETAVGDWLSVNEKFPQGMAALAREVRDAGYEPGLWLAPFTVAANSRFAREHPQWLVHNAKGAPAYGGTNWGTDLYALDTSHPEACDWLRQLFSTVVNEWGYRYLKLDFLASAAFPGQRHDPTMTRAKALRNGLALIREVVGDEVFLLGCGCPLLSAVGIVDAMRIGPDSAPHWSPRYKGMPLPLSEGYSLPTMEGALRNTLTRAWMAPALWANDPDCLILRGQQSDLTLDEVRAFATAVGLTGGMALLSDRLAQLSLERIEMLARLLPPIAERALPASPFAPGIPERITMRIVRPWGAWLLVGLFNSEAKARDIALLWSELGLENGAYHAVEFWTERYLGLTEAGTTVHLNPHGAAALAIHAASDQPLLLSTNLHISQGGAEIAEWEYDQEQNAITWGARPGRHAVGSFTLWLPAALSPARLTSDAASATYERRPDGIVIVTAEIDGEARLTLHLERESE